MPIFSSTRLENREGARDQTSRLSLVFWISFCFRRDPGRGYSISATPALLYSPPHQEAVKEASLERILLETDAPVVYQGKESRPKDVRITLGEVARLKGLDSKDVSKQTTANAAQFFGIPFER